jgi:hypothetical protein
MLTVDISFLALPSVNMGSDQSQTAATLATYLSILCTMGSLMVTIVLAGHGSRVDSDHDVMVSLFFRLFNIRPLHPPEVHGIRNILRG